MGRYRARITCRHGGVTIPRDTIIESVGDLSLAFPDRFVDVDAPAPAPPSPRVGRTPPSAPTTTNVGQRGDDLQAPRPRHAELVVGCYTPGDYEKEANERLIKSVKELGLAHDIREIPSRGSWVLNNSACQIFLRKMHDEMPDVDFLYIDVDGMVRANPWSLLRTLDCDVAAYYLHDRELLSGTLYLPATERRCELLTKWIDFNRAEPSVWDQVHLQSILAHDTVNRFRAARLPAEMCFIFDTQRKLTPGLAPIVEHFQASRRYRARAK